MTVTLLQLAFYAGALFLLFLTPGPVWVALIARALAGGFHAAWPLALGVVVGDVIWPIVAIFGVAYIATLYADFLTVLRWLGAVIFIVMGAQLILNRDKGLGTSDSRMTAPGVWAGFAAGLLVIMGNPKAILFYMGVLPGFFDFAGLTWVDIALIVALSFVVPLVGNLILALMVDRVRRLLRSAEALRRLNTASGLALICVGVVIALSAL